MIHNTITLNTLNDCLLNNHSMCTILKGEKIRLMIVKYSHLNTWEIKVLERDKDHILAIYDHLYIYDTYNMIKELCVEL